MNLFNSLSSFAHSKDKEKYDKGIEILKEISQTKPDVLFNEKIQVVASQSFDDYLSQFTSYLNSEQFEKKICTQNKEEILKLDTLFQNTLKSLESVNQEAVAKEKQRGWDQLLLAIQKEHLILQLELSKPSSLKETASSLNEDIQFSSKIKDKTSFLQEDFKALTTKTASFIAKIEQEPESITWLGKLYDEGVGWLKKASPTFKSWHSQLVEWGASRIALSMPEQDRLDFQTVHLYQEEIETLHVLVKEFKSKLEKADPVTQKQFQEFDAIQKLVGHWSSLIHFHISYFEEIEKLEPSLVELDKQSESLLEGKQAFSSSSYLNVVEDSIQLNQFALREKKKSEDLQEEIDRKIDYQISRIVSDLEEFSEDFMSEFEAECEESLFQFDTVYQTIYGSNLIDDNLFQTFQQGAYPLEAQLNQCHEWNHSCKAFIKNEGVTDKIKEQVALMQIFIEKLQNKLEIKLLKKDEAEKYLLTLVEKKPESIAKWKIELQKIQKDLETHPLPPISHETYAFLKTLASFNTSKNSELLRLSQKAQKLLLKPVFNDDFLQSLLQAYRNDRKTVLTSLKKRTLWANRTFNQEDSSLSPTTLNWIRAIFFYLQVSQPIVSKFMTPVTKPTYSYFLRMMAKVSRENKADTLQNSYDYYLEQARSFPEADEDFLNQYDAYLKGNISFTYEFQPNPADSGKLPQSSVSENLYDQVRSYLPSQIDTWIQTFLGLNPADQTAWNRTPWESYLIQQVEPQLKNDFFEKLGEYFEQIDPSLQDQPPENESSSLGYAFYHMYQNLKNSTETAKIDYSLYREQIKEHPEYFRLLQDFEQHFSKNPPKQETPFTPYQEYSQKESSKSEHSSSSSIESSPRFQSLALPGDKEALHTIWKQPESMTSAAAKTNEHFFSTFSKGIKDAWYYFNSSTTSTANIDERLGTALDSAFQDSKQRLNQLKLEVSTLKENLKEIYPSSHEQDSISLLKHELEKEFNLIEARLNQVFSFESRLEDVETWITSIKTIEKKVSELNNQGKEILKQQEELKQEQQKAIELKNFIESAPVSIDDSLLLHLIGDFFGQKTGLEGSYHEQILNYRYALLQQYLSVIKHKNGIPILLETIGISEQTLSFKEKEIIKWIRQLERAIKIETKLSKDVKSLANYIEATLPNLPLDEALFMAGGWVGDPGHAMYYEFSKQENGLYSFRIYNTGEGIQYHAQQVQGYKGQIITFTELVDIPLENITRLEWLKGLLELKKMPPDNMKKWNKDDIYRKLVNHLEGKPSPHEYSEEKLRTAQRSGTCAFMSLDAVLSDKTPNKLESRKLKLQTMLKGISDYTKLNGHTLISNERSRRLLDKTSEEIARAFNTGYDDGVLNGYELNVATSRIKEIREFLENQKQSYLSQVRDLAPVVKIGHYNSNIDSSFVNLIVTSPKNKEPLSLSTEHPHVLNLNEWSPSSEKLISDLQTFKSYFELANNEGNPGFALRKTEELMRKLPFPMSNGKKLWSKLSLEEQVQAISIFSEIAKTGYQSLLGDIYLHPEKAMQIEPLTMMAFFKTMILSHQLLSIAKNIPPEDIPFHPFSFDLVKNNKHPYFRLYDPEAERQLQEMQQYTERFDFHLSNIFPLHKVAFHTLKKLTHFNYIDNTPLEKFIKKAGLWNKIYSKYPQFDKMSSFEEKLELLLQKENHDFLPDYFYAMKDLEFTLDSILTFSLNPSELEKPPTFDLKIKLREYDYTCHTYVTGTKSQFNEYGRILYNKNKSWNELSRTYGLHFSNAHQWIQDKNLISIYLHREDESKLDENNFYLFHLKEMSENENLVFNPDKVKGLNNEILRALLKLTGEKELQIVEILDFFNRHLILLKNLDYQTFFEILLFEPGLLLDELKKGINTPLPLEIYLAQFVKKGYQFYLDLADYEAASFFLYLNTQLKKHFKFAGSVENLKLNPQAVFLDTRQEIRHLLEGSHLSESARSLLSQNLILSYANEKNLSKESLQEILFAAFYLKTFPISSSFSSKHHELMAKRVLIDLKDEIKEFNHSPESEFLMNAIVEISEKESDQRKWSSKFPISKSQDGIYQINFQTFTVSKNENGKTQLPENIRQSPNFKVLFGELDSLIVDKTHADAYEFVFKEKKYRVIQSEHQFVIQHEMSSNGNKNWYEYNPRTSLPFSNFRGLKENHLHWIAIDPVAEMLITDVIEHLPKYRVQLKKYDGEAETLVDAFSLKTIHLLDHEGNDSNLLLTHVGDPSSPWNFLTRFEDSDYILLWRDQNTHVAKQIEFVRFKHPNLSFEINKIDGKLKVFSKELPGFFLTEKQFVPALKDFPNFLLLENKEGEKRVILPRQEFQFSKLKDEESANIEKPGSLDTISIQPKRSDNSAFLTEYQALYYAIDDLNGMLKPQSEEGRFYLSMLYLWKHEYELAASYLRGSESFLRKWTDGEVEVLRWICTLRKNNHDQDPRAISLSLLASYLLLRNNEIYKNISEIDSIIETLPGLYESYLNQFNNLSSLKLSVEEEKFLLKNFPQPSGVILNRKIDLEGASLPIEKLEKDVVYNESQDDIPTLNVFHTGASSSHFDQDKEAASFVDNYNQITLDQQRSDSERSDFILRPALFPIFNEVYQLARGELREQEAINVYEKLTGIKLKTWNKEHLAFSLKMMENTISNDNEITRRIFQAILHEPDAFPSFSDLNINLNLKEQSIINPKIYETAASYVKIHLYSPLLDVEKKFNLQKIQLHVPRPPNQIQPSQTEATSIKTKQNIVPIPYQFCLQVASPLQNHFPLVQDLKKMGINSKIKEFSGLDSTKNLEKVLTVKSEDPLILKNFSEVKDSVAAYRKEKEADKIGYYIENKNGLSTFWGELKSDLASAEKELKEREEILLDHSRRLSLEQTEVSQEHLQRIGEGKKQLDINSLIQLFWRKDAALFHERNKALTPEEIISIQDEITEYLQFATYLQHLRRMSSLINQINRAESKNLPVQEKEELVKQLVQQATASRTYDIKEYPEYLVLEYYMDILMRKDQADNLSSLHIKEAKISHSKDLGLILEMIMGAGKSSVLMPLLGILHADGERLAMAIVPEPLLATVAKNLEHLLGTTFKQPIHVKHFERNTHLDKESLQNILKELEGIRENRQLLLMTAESIQSLYLKYIETLNNSSQKPENHEIFEEIALFRKIFTLFKEKGYVVIDEADLILNAQKQHHFTIGEPIRFNNNEANLVLTLYEILGKDLRIQKKMHFDFIPNFQEGKPFNPDDYQKEVVPILVNVILEKNLASSDETVIDFLAKLTAEQKEWVRRYLMNEKEDEIQSFISEKAPSLVKDLLALAKEEIHVLLPLTCNKKIETHYGLADRKKIAIPFHGSNNPALKSQFGSPYETINYTLQAQLKYEIPLDFIKDRIDKLKVEALKELNADKRKNVQATQAHLEFLKLSEGDPQLTLFGSDHDLQTLSKKINSNISLKLSFIKDLIIPQIITYPETISATPQVFNFLFKSVQGFTGTQWNAETFPKDIRTTGSPTIIGKTLSLLNEHSHDQVTVTSKFKSQNIMQELFQGNPGLHQTHAFIDTDGMASGISNLSIAKQILQLTNLQREKPINGVVFYDEKDNLMVLERGKNTPISLSETSIPIEERFTFYDQTHTTGSDIKQIPAARGFVSIGKHTILRDLLQCVWRFRGLDKSQRIQFILDEETESIIRKSLQEIVTDKLPEKLTFEELTLFVTYKQSSLKGDHNYRSFKDKMTAVLQAEAFDAFNDVSLSNRELKDFIKELGTLFITENVQSPWELFGNVQTHISKEQSVNEKLESTSNLFNEKTLLKQRDSKNQIELELKAVAMNSQERLPLKILKAANYNQEIEVETEKEKEIELEKETELEIEKNTQNSNKRSRRHYASYLYLPDNFFMKNLVLQPIDDISKEIYSTTLNKFFSMNQLSQKYIELPIQDVFDTNILSTSNFQPIHEAETFYTSFETFGYNQKPISNILVLENRKTHYVQIILLDQKDTLDMEDKLRDYASIEGGSLSLYNFERGFYQSHLNAADLGQLKSNPHFLKLIVQAKFFDGQLEYSLEEIPYLQEWITTKGINKMEALFRDVILKWKVDRQSIFPISPIGQIFKLLKIHAVKIQTPNPQYDASIHSPQTEPDASIDSPQLEQDASIYSPVFSFALINAIIGIAALIFGRIRKSPQISNKKIESDVNKQMVEQTSPTLSSTHIQKIDLSESIEKEPTLLPNIPPSQNETTEIKKEELPLELPDTNITSQPPVTQFSTPKIPVHEPFQEILKPSTNSTSNQNISTENIKKTPTVEATKTAEKIGRLRRLAKKISSIGIAIFEKIKRLFYRNRRT